MAFRYDDVDAGLRERIERGVVAIRRINSHENFENWIQVGEACADMQTAAMRLAGANDRKGRGYNAAFKVIAHEVPDLAKLDKTTRSHAVWLATHQTAVVAWHQSLPTNIRQQVNHPTAVWRRYNRETAIPKKPGEETAEPSLTPSQKQAAALLQLQEDLDAANHKIRRLERESDDLPLVSRSATANDIARVLLEWIPLSKRHPVASAMMRALKSTEPAKPKRGSKAAKHVDGTG